MAQIHLRVSKMSKKLKLAIYWAGSCGGCDVAIADIGERLVEVDSIADIVFWPVAMDYKYEDVEKLEAQSIDYTIFNGMIRTSEHEHIAKLLREKSRYLIAFGSCACFGGIPSLANLYSAETIMKTAYEETPSTVNPDKVRPQPKASINQYTLTLPTFYDHVYSLGQIVKVDYMLPGCPPAVKLVNKLIDAIASGEPPSKWKILPDYTQCEECGRKKLEEVKLRRFKRIHEEMPDPEICLLDQGFICLGPVTRAGCGAQCINANMPCRGCMGPAPGVADVGAKMIATLSTIIDDELPPEEVSKLIKDLVGTLYRHGLASSIFGGKVKK